MKKLRKTFLILLLAFALLFVTACSDVNGNSGVLDNSDVTGNFDVGVESEDDRVQAPLVGGKISAPKILFDGAIYSYDSSGNLIDPYASLTVPETILYDENGVTFTVIGMDVVPMFVALDCSLKNSTDKDIFVTLENVSVNGFMIKPYGVAGGSVGAGETSEHNQD